MCKNDYASASAALSSLPTTWTDYLVQTVTPPVGYRFVTVLLTAGATVPTPPASRTTTVHVRPMMAGTLGPEQAVRYDSGGASPPSSALSGRFALNGPFQLWLSAYSEGSAVGVTVQLTASLMFTRG